MTDNFDQVNNPGTPAAPENPTPEVPVLEVPAPEAPYTDPFQGQQPPQAPVPPVQQPYQGQYQGQYQQPPQGQYQQPAPGQYPPPQGYPQYPQQPQQVRYDVPPQGYPQKSRLAAAILALTLGVFGVHNYYMGFKNKFIIQLVITLVGSLLCGIGPLVSEIWALIEGIQLLLANDPSKLYDANGVRMKD